MKNPDRVAFIFFERPIYWYGILIAFGIIVAIFLAMKEARRKKINEDTMLDIFILVILFGVVGARLFYILFEWQSYFASGVPWWKPFAIWEGGLAIFGAIIGGAASLAVYCKQKKLNFLMLLDSIGPGLVLAQAIGRWGNFFNQEAYGLPVTNPKLLWFPFTVNIDVPWFNGIHYFDGQICTEPFHMATFFFESLWCALVFLVLWFFIRKRVKHYGDVFLWYVLLYGFERMFVEGWRGDSLWLVPGAVRVSQALSFLLFFGVLAFFLVRYFREKQLGSLIWAPMAEEALLMETAAPMGEAGETATFGETPSMEAGVEEHKHKEGETQNTVVGGPTQSEQSLDAESDASPEE